MLCLFASQACAMRYQVPFISSQPPSPPMPVSQAQQAPSYPSYGVPNRGRVQVPIQRAQPQRFNVPPQPVQPPASLPYQNQRRPVQRAMPVQAPAPVKKQQPNPYSSLMQEAQQCVDIAMEMNDTAYYLHAAQEKNGKYFIPVLSSNLAFLKRLFKKYRCNRWYGYNETKDTTVVGGGAGSSSDSNVNASQEKPYDYDTYLNVDGY